MFEVVDTGRGIAPKDQEKIFEPFNQEESGAKKGGTGLGLAISSKQLQLMGSKLCIDSEPGKGSRFHFTLQLKKATGEIERRSERVKDVLHLAEGCRVKALIVDDVKENRDVLKTFLSDIKVETMEAENGQEALEKVRDYGPDIIFMDIRMPVMDGKEAIKKIRQEFGEDRFKIVVITASALDQDRQNFAKLGADGFIAKPFRGEQIIDCISGLLDIEFEYDQQQEKNDKQSAANNGTIDYSKIDIPKELYLQLKEAAYLNNITQLDKIIKTLEDMDENCSQTADRIKDSLRIFDMDTINEIVEKLNPEKK